ncbi:hypothetical protein MASR2M48_19220 [Spirochaetota bacterium]
MSIDTATGEQCHELRTEYMAVGEDDEEFWLERRYQLSLGVAEPLWRQNRYTQGLSGFCHGRTRKTEAPTLG